MYWVATGEACNPPEGVPASKLGFGRVLSAVEFFGLVFHGPNVTHLDTAAHLFWDGRLYNDRPAAMTGAEHGALWCSVATMKDGVVGRGVLLDVARHLDVDALEPGTSVTAAQLQAAADAQGVAVGPGDIVLLRCGRWHQSLQSGAARRESDDFTKWEPKSGWHPDCMPWLHERDVAMIGCDYPQDPIPPSSFDIPGTIHVLALVTMGMPLLDNCDLEALASTCAELGRWEFQFVMSPLRIVGGSGSPVNPIAVF
jgi:kynurenine formamidase